MPPAPPDIGLQIDDFPVFVDSRCACRGGEIAETENDRRERRHFVLPPKLRSIPAMDGPQVAAGFSSLVCDGRYVDKNLRNDVRTPIRPNTRTVASHNALEPSNHNSLGTNHPSRYTATASSRAGDTGLG